MGIMEDEQAAWLIRKNQTVEVRIEVLETVLQYNGYNASLPGEVVEEIRRAMGEKP